MVFREWDPFEEMDRLYRRLHEMMRRAWEPVREPWTRFRNEWRYAEFPVDISETNSELVLHADLPGFEKDEIKVRVTEDTIDISAKKREEKKEVSETMYRRERMVGAVRRFITLPVTVDPENVKAEYKNGVLTVRMKKKESKRGREIKIE